MSSAPPCLMRLELFQPLTPDLVDKALDRCRATTSFDPCPAWLIKADRSITTEWTTVIINGSLLEGKVPPALKETLIRLIRKKPNLAVDDIGNYRPVANVSFLSKVVERVVADQLQALLNERGPISVGLQAAPQYGNGTGHTVG